MQEGQILSILVDGISALGVHNGVVRIQFFRLLADGKSQVTLELQIPQNQVKNLITGLTKVSG